MPHGGDQARVQPGQAGGASASRTARSVAGHGGTYGRDSRRGLAVSAGQPCGTRNARRRNAGRPRPALSAARTCPFLRRWPRALFITLACALRLSWVSSDSAWRRARRAAWRNWPSAPDRARARPGRAHGTAGLVVVGAVAEAALRGQGVDVAELPGIELFLAGEFELAHARGIDQAAAPGAGGSGRGAWWCWRPRLSCDAPRPSPCASLPSRVLVSVDPPTPEDPTSTTLCACPDRVQRSPGWRHPLALTHRVSGGTTVYRPPRQRHHRAHDRSWSHHHPCATGAGDRQQVACLDAARD